ncbi:MAG: pantoate--beta-alanine ligase, partial [Gammaproteobacteria bacterium]|nr:pantoate--beta-alanine ligase [Gammaproteobacteria bacterium]
MQTLQRTASQIRETIAGWRAARDSIALVPTMGNLHAGHL